jgi:hypothetical protein
VVTNAWADINTTPQTNVTLKNSSLFTYNGSWMASSNNTYQFKVYARDIVGNLNDTTPWQTFSIRNPNATAQNAYAPSIALPFHVVKVTGKLNATDSLRDVYAFLNAPSEFTFLSNYSQNSHIGNLHCCYFQSIFY